MQEDSKKTPRYGLIGRGIGYSMSKTLHEDLFARKNIDATYDIIDIDDIASNIENLRENYDGFNVTKPYKVEIMNYLDEIDERAREIGSVNTVTNINGVLKGYNTDLDGILSTFALDGVEVSGKRCLIIGYGGVSKTLIYAVNLMGAEVINIAGRNREKILSLIDEMNNIGIVVGIDQNVSSSYDIVINATTLGTSIEHPTPIDVRLIHDIEYYFDLVYNPRCTLLMRKCAENGTKVRDGLYMLLMQAVKAQEFYLGVTFSNEDIFDAYLHLAGEIFLKQHNLQGNANILLVGFMGSGKSTIGKRLSEILGIELVDTDAVIERRFGAIKEIFDTRGEEYFREIETEVLSEVLGQSNTIISTGGGIVINEKNRSLIKENENTSTIYLDTRFDTLCERVEGSDRPLFRDIESARRLYETRVPLYSDVADIVVDASGDVDGVVTEIFSK